LLVAVVAVVVTVRTVAVVVAVADIVALGLEKTPAVVFRRNPFLMLCAELLIL
jgi:hypothetical protein